MLVHFHTNISRSLNGNRNEPTLGSLAHRILLSPPTILSDNNLRTISRKLMTTLNVSSLQDTIGRRKISERHCSAMRQNNEIKSEHADSRNEMNFKNVWKVSIFHLLPIIHSCNPKFKWFGVWTISVLISLDISRDNQKENVVLYYRLYLQYEYKLLRSYPF